MTDTSPGLPRGALHGYLNEVGDADAARTVARFAAALA